MVLKIFKVEVEFLVIDMVEMGVWFVVWRVEFCLFEMFCNVGKNCIFGKCVLFKVIEDVGGKW